MADIVLKNRNGEDVTYEGVTELTLPTADGGTQTFEKPYRLVSLGMYYAKAISNYFPDGSTGFQITDGLSTNFGGSVGAITGCDPDACVEFGDENGRVWIILTKKRLNIGQVYSSSEMVD